MTDRGLRLTGRGGTVAALAWVAFLLTVAVAQAADPTATPAPGGDVRTDPAAPGLVGDPLFAILGVALVGILAVALTLVAARIAGRR